MHVNNIARSEINVRNAVCRCFSQHRPKRNLSDRMNKLSALIKNYYKLAYFIGSNVIHKNMTFG